AMKPPCDHIAASDIVVCRHDEMRQQRLVGEGFACCSRRVSTAEYSRAILSGPSEERRSSWVRREASARRSARLTISPCPFPSIAACGSSTKLLNPSESQ